MAEDLVIYTPMYVTFFWAMVLLLSKRENNRAKFFLGVFMFIAFLLYLSHAHFFQRIASVFQYFNALYIFASLSVYPLYYWYIKLLTVDADYRWSNLKFLFPGVILASVSLVLYQLMSQEERLVYFSSFLMKNESNDAFSNVMYLQKLVYYISRIVFAVQVVYFVFQGQKLVRRYNKQIANFYSNLESKSIVWVNVILYSLVITSVMSIIFNIIGRRFFMDSMFLLLIPSIIFSVLLFIIGLEGYMQNHTVLDLEVDALQNENIIHKNENTNKLKEKLLELFASEAIYKNPDLKITHISEKLHTNRTYISKLINTEFSCTFSEFVNRYRISEAKRLLSEDSSKNYSLDYISEKSGFGSMVNFMRVFREIEGTTPGRFRESNLS